MTVQSFKFSNLGMQLNVMLRKYVEQQCKLDSMTIVSRHKSQSDLLRTKKCRTIFPRLCGHFRPEDSGKSKTCGQDVQYGHDEFQDVRVAKQGRG